VLFTIRTIANKSIHGQFVNHTIERTYRVLMVGDTESQVCTLPLVHTRTGARVGVSGEPGSREAATRFRRLAALAPQPGTTLMEVSLETGRRHQIRVHAQALGHPILGDRTYGSCAGPGLHLHAWRLGFEHPLERGRIVLVHSELPEWARSTDCDSKPT
jgi:23S rRNA pseudouridine1911/1915/1917 synthase